MSSGSRLDVATRCFMRRDGGPSAGERDLDPEAEEPDAATYQDATRRFQARFLREALEASGWNVSETARRIGVARSHLNDLIKVFGLSRKDAAPREPARRRGA